MAIATIEWPPPGHKLFSYASGKVQVFVSNNESSKEPKKPRRALLLNLTVKFRLNEKLEDED